MIIILGLALGGFFFALTVVALLIQMWESQGAKSPRPSPKMVRERFWCLYCEKDFYETIRSAAYMPEGKQEIPPCPNCLLRDLVVTDDDYQVRTRDDWSR